MVLKKKSHPTFNVPNFGAKKRKGVKERWRKSRGIDSKKRIKMRFAGAEPTIGYRNPEELRGVRASGKRAVRIENAKQLNDLLANPDIEGYEITLAGALSRRKKIELTQIANKNKINVTNGAMK
jgi:large subunit ribosomal protein L32e